MPRIPKIWLVAGGGWIGRGLQVVSQLVAVRILTDSLGTHGYGMFAVLASLTALTILRLETGEEAAVRHSVALTESFIADMDAQMREQGFGDPSIGKQVRSRVGALATRVDRWRNAREDRDLWEDAVRFSVYRDSLPPVETALTYSSEALRRFDEGLSGLNDRHLIEGKIG